MIEVYKAVKQDGTLCQGTLTVNTRKHRGAAKMSLLNAYSRLHRVDSIVKVAEDGKECYKKVKLVKQPQKRAKNTRVWNNTGIRHVYKVKCPSCTQGFMFQYNWKDEDGDKRFLSSQSLEKLEQRAKEYGLPWEVVN